MISPRLLFCQRQQNTRLALTLPKRSLQYQTSDSGRTKDAGEPESIDLSVVVIFALSSHSADVGRGFGPFREAALPWLTWLAVIWVEGETSESGVGLVM